MRAHTKSCSYNTMYLCSRGYDTLKYDHDHLGVLPGYSLLECMEAVHYVGGEGQRLSCQWTRG